MREMKRHLIFLQTFPDRIHRLGSVCHRHLGEIERKVGQWGLWFPGARADF
jgi:hypothetical protein